MTKPSANVLAGSGNGGRGEGFPLPSPGLPCHYNRRGDMSREHEWQDQDIPDVPDFALREEVERNEWYERVAEETEQ